MVDILVFAVITLIFGGMRLRRAKKEAAAQDYGEVVYPVPKRVFFPQIAAMLVGIALMVTLLVANLNTPIIPGVPTVVLAAGLGLLSGLQFYVLVNYLAVPIGFYENGLLTHGRFLTYEGFKYYVVDESKTKNKSRARLWLCSDRMGKSGVYVDVRRSRVLHIQAFLQSLGMEETTAEIAAAEERALRDRYVVRDEDDMDLEEFRRPTGEAEQTEAAPEDPVPAAQTPADNTADQED